MNATNSSVSNATQQRWLKRYYYMRAAFSLAWVGAAFGLASRYPIIAAVLLLIYPAWDAIANYLDAQRSGGLRQNRSQAINFVVSLVTTIAVLIAMQASMHGVLGVYGAWAILSGLLQLGAAIKRRKYGAQWAMMLSGGQSALAGGFFIYQSLQPGAPSIANIAGYATVGAIYFLISALWLTFISKRSPAVMAP